MRRPRLPRSFRRQIVVLTAGITAVAMLLLTLVVQLVLARITNSDVDRVLQDRADAVISSATTGPGGELVVPSTQLDAGVAVYDDQGTLVAGDPPDSLSEHYADLSSVDTRTVETHAEHGRILAEPFTATGGAAGVVIVTERLEPYEEAERLALIVTLVTGLLTTVAAAAIAAWTTRRALRPVAVMAERLPSGASTTSADASTSVLRTTSSARSPAPSTSSSRRSPPRSARSNGSPRSWPTSSGRPSRRSRGWPT